MFVCMYIHYTYTWLFQQLEWNVFCGQNPKTKDTKLGFYDFVNCILILSSVSK